MQEEKAPPSLLYYTTEVERPQATVLVQPNPNGDWQNGLFQCDPFYPDCLTAFCCRPYFAAYTSHIMGMESTCTGWQLIDNAFGGTLGVFWLRKEAREAKQIQGTCCNDFLVSCFCPCCALVQIKREFELVKD